MAERTIKHMVRGERAVDGAGVNLVRVLGHDTVKEFDPFLMLDSFDSTDPNDYIKGFPVHPHRGIETITYLAEGEIEHKDSLGNGGVIKSGQGQWMTAGSGIMHEEMPKASPRMLGLQFWLNLPKDQKMTDPQYFDITDKMIGEVDIDGGHVRVISGEYNGTKGAQPSFIQASMFDVVAEPGKSVSIPAKTGETVFVFLLEGDAVVSGKAVPEKTAVLFGDEGDSVTVAAAPDAPARFIFCSGKPLGEDVAWGGPIVMNTQDELAQAHRELSEGTFVKHEARM